MRFPLKLFVFWYTSFFLLMIFAPLNLVHKSSNEAKLFFLVNMALVSLFFCIIFILQKDKRLFLVPKVHYGGVKTVFRIIFSLVLFGVILRLYENFFVRGLHLGADLRSNYDIVKASGSSMLGLVSGILYSMGGALYFMFRWSESNKCFKFGFVSRTLIIFLSIYIALDVMLVGKRGAALIILTMIFLIELMFSLKRVSFFKLLSLFSIAFLFIFFFMYIFVQRIESFGFDLYHSINTSGYAFTVKPSYVIYEFNLENKGSFINTVVLSLTNIVMYLIHGVYEFLYVFDNESFKELQLGGYTFSLYNKVIMMLMGAENASNIDVVRFGVYTTFLGPLLYDFGWYSILFVAFYLFIILLVAQKSLRDVSYIPLYCYLLVTLLFFPVVNMIQSGLGLYFFTGTIIFLIVNKLFNRKLV